MSAAEANQSSAMEHPVESKEGPPEPSAAAAANDNSSGADAPTEKVHPADADAKAAANNDPAAVKAAAPGDGGGAPVAAAKPTGAKKEAADDRGGAKANEKEEEEEEDPPTRRCGRGGAAPQKKKRELAPLGRLFAFGDSCDAFMIFLGVVGAIVSGGVLPAFALLFGDLINKINSPDPAEAADAVRDIALKYLWVGLGMFGAGFLRVFGFTASAARQAHRFRGAYFKQMLRQDIGWHDLTAGKEFTSKLADATEKFREAIGVKLGDVISYVAAFGVGLGIGFYVNWKLTLVIISLFPIAGGLGAGFGAVMASAAAAGARAYSKAGGVAEEAIGSIRTVTALNAQADTFALYSGHLTAAQKMSEKSSMNSGLVFGSFNLFMFCSYALAFWYGATLLIDPNEDFQGGDILTVFFCVLFGAVNIGQAGPSISSIQEAQGVAFEAFKVIDRVPETDIESAEGQLVTREGCKGAIELRDVEFTYPTRPDSQVLKGVSFTVPAGTSLALVGGSGCGKSTCVALIQRFYEPAAGVVLLDGVDVRGINVTALRNLIGIVSQEPQLFATTILENIRLGAGSARAEPTDEEVFEAAKQANIHAFIAGLPNGYNTPVGDQGIQLSGGQKQRVAIARALLRNPKILLLDEATSALDTQSERVVQAALDNLMAERTTIMIAHRLSTVKKATKIIVMEQGRIIEQGSHDELAHQEGGVYAEMARLQALHEAEGRGGGVKSIPTEVHPDSDEDDPDTVALKAAAAAATTTSSRKASGSGSGGAMVAAGVAEDGAGDAKAERKAQMALARSRQQRLMKLAFSNGCEGFQLFVACIMAAGAGILLPIFSIIFTDILEIFFMCTPIELFGVNQYGCDFAMAAGLNENSTVQDVQAVNATCSHSLETCNDTLLADATQFSLYFLAIAAGAGVAAFLQNFLFGKIGSVLTMRLRQESFAAILKQDIAFFDEDANSTGALTTKLAKDAAIVEAAVSKNIGMYVQNTSTIVAALIIAFIAGWQLTLLMLALLPFLIIGNVIRTRTRLNSKSAKDATDSETQAGQIVSESVRGVRTVASFGIQANLLKLYDGLVGAEFTGALGSGACAGVAYGYSQFIMFAIYTAAFYYAAFLIDELIYAAPDILRVFFVLLMSAFSIGQAVALNSEVARGQQAIPRIFDIIERESACDPTSPDGLVVPAPVSAGIQGRIEFKDVKFSYPSRKGKVLKGVSFVVEPGQTVALVGSSGSGKSTIFGLIERFYNLDGGSGSGEITLDGRPITDYNIATLRRVFGVVEQEPRLFGTTIRENLVLGLEPRVLGTDGPTAAAGTPASPAAAAGGVGANAGDIEMAVQADGDTLDNQIDRALEAASAAQFTSGLDDGLQTQVGESGKSQMSGGQKQRIAIARALLRDAPIMLLDEATSALDSESEKLVQGALERIMRERTTLVIAHRLSTIQDADQIIVLDQGEIVERGTHQSLLALKGKYFDLCREQSMATA